MTRFLVYSGEKVIGTSDLEAEDRSMAVAAGRFTPAEAYAAAGPVFRTWVRAMAPTLHGRAADTDLVASYFRQRDALSLSVRTPSGEVVATEWVHVDDYSEDLGADGYQLSIAVSDRSAFERLFPERSG